MKTLQSSSRGRGGGGRGFRARGRGGRGREGRAAGGEDERFSSRFTDPRFQLSTQLSRKPRDHSNPHDELAAAARSDPRFARHFDSRARRNGKAAPPEDEDENEEATSHSESSEQHGSSDDADGDGPSLGEGGESGEEGEAEASADDDDDVNAWEPEETEMIEARHRIAVVNCDWDHVRAVDLYAILFHALPLGGQLKDVCVYMSEFGKKMIERERTYGPDLWYNPAEPGAGDDAEGNAVSEPAVEELPEDNYDDDDNDDDNASSEAQSDGWQDDNPAMMEEEGENGEVFSSGKYRKYEMDRMKYYYAVATFDSADTAAAVYQELDGMDIEASGVVLDLRYVDDEDTFERPVSRADGIPPNFKPLSSFKAAALSQSHFRISWDQDDVFRHHSVQDSFTGTTAEDDLAAYLAPPDSDVDDDTTDPHTGRTKAEEKLRIRRKYAALLEEIGGLADTVDADDADAEHVGERAGQHGADSHGDDDDDGVDGEDSSHSSSSGSDDDDDSLNRFSDVEIDEDGDDNADGTGMEEMEATLDLDVESKAVELARETRLKQKLAHGDLAAKAEMKYKQRRKEMKKAKKEFVMQEREAETAALAAQKDHQKQQLKALIGTDDDGAVHVSGKERRKMHAKKVKERLAEERAAKKRMRVANQLGVSREAQEEKEAVVAQQAIDARFQSKLLTDPRYHLEVAQRDRRVADDVAQLAATVAKARRGKRSHGTEAVAGGDGDGLHTTHSASPAQNDAGVGSAVDYFLTQQHTKRPRRV